MSITISSGHGLHIRGARDIIDEVDEARHVTNRVADILRNSGVPVSVFHDDVSRSVGNNIGAIVRHHNSQRRDLNCSIYFNSVSGGTREAGIGTETLYRAGNAHTRDIASRVSKAISDASGLILRRGDGTMARTDLGFLNQTNAPAILLEICFVNSRTDVRLYREHFEEICRAIAAVISGQNIQGGANMEKLNFRINGKEMQFDGTVINDRTFVMPNDLVPAMGGTLRWDAATSTRIIEIPRGGQTLTPQEAEKIASRLALQVKEQIRNGLMNNNG